MNFANDRPIYLQLVEVFQAKISSGEWPVGKKIDPVRSLAQDYGVNPNTVQRALREMDSLGLTQADRTRGRFVTLDKDKVKDLTKDQVYQACEDFIRIAQDLDLDMDQALKTLKDYWIRREKEDD